MPLSERAMIARIRRSSRSTGAVVTGIGDDCAVLRLPAGHEALVTTDFTLENIHFRRNWHPAEAVGHRCLTRGLSDIAAMGGKPRAAFLSLAVPANLPQKWVNDFFAGLLRLAGDFGVALAGGDIAQSPDGILADIMVIGSAPPGEAIRRSGAKPGDNIYVTGELGGSSAALELLLTGRHKHLRPKDFPRHFHPEPRVAIGMFLSAKKLASAMIDTSDGLSTDLAHICEESGVGAVIVAEAIPCAVIPGSRRTGSSPVELRSALHGGEDYELIFTAPASKRIPPKIAGTKITRIGEMIRGKAVAQISEGGTRRRLPQQGWEHFKSK